MGRGPGGMDFMDRMDNMDMMDGAPRMDTDHLSLLEMPARLC